MPLLHFARPDEGVYATVSPNRDAVTPLQRLNCQVWQLLNQPELIRSEIERRLQEHQQSSPVEQRREQVTKEIVRVEQQTNKLLDAYQEGLMEMAALRQRMPELKRRQQALKKELESLALQAVEKGRLVEMNVSMERFMEQLRSSGQQLDVEQKQKIVRLLVRQVDVGPDTVTIHHSIRLSPHLDGQKEPNYRLCMSRHEVETPYLPGAISSDPDQTGVNPREK